MTEPEFPENNLAYDSAGNCLGECKPLTSDHAIGSAAFSIENKILDIRVIQKDRAATMPGYRLVTFDEMEADPPAKQWLIKFLPAGRHRHGSRRLER